MKTTTEQKMTIELSYEDYKHIKSLLAQSKPSRTRLTQEEKGMILFMCNRWLEEFSGDVQDDKLIESIKKKLN